VSASAPLIISIDGIRRVDGEATLLGRAYILGVLHHAWLLQVIERAAEQLAVDDPHHRLDDLHYLAGDAGPFETIDVPGFPGRYALVIAPGVR
jgi:hypothetical protein